MSSYPKIFRVRQSFEGPRIEDVPGEVKAQLSRLKLSEKIRPGQSVAVTAGSRGIANIKDIIRATVEHLKSLDAKPFIIPAMGSHGGGTPDGQRHVIESYGITEQFCGCTIRSSMETVVICRTAEGIPVHFDKQAYEADHVLVCGRVKPHTNFVGEIESGLMKMMLIGLGKHEGAKIYHRAIQNFSFGQIVHSVAGHVLEKCHIVAGLGIVENAYDQTAKIAAVAPHEFAEREKELLKLAKQWMPRLPFPQVDILLIDEIGKNISGSGMDTNVVGRKFKEGAAAETEVPRVKRIVVRALTEETHGNATGIGNAEFCTTRLIKQMDVRATQINCLTGGSPNAAKVPIHFETDREVLDAALPTIGLTDPPDARLLWIRNTLDVAEVECSAAYLDEAKTRADLTVLTEPRELQFDRAGNLPYFAGNGRNH
jgi:nickel-dependent lactate racemase